MAQETQRQFHDNRRAIEVRVTDDLGIVHVVMCHLGSDKCPSCKREYPQTSGQIDFEALVKQVCDELHVETGKVIEAFERHGRSMTEAKEKRAQRLANQTSK